MRSQFVPNDEPIDVTNCDREPIHTPGSIQPHGAILLLDPSTERVLSVSANVEEFTGVPLRDAVNALAADVLGAPAADAVRAAARSRESGTAPIATRLGWSGNVGAVSRTADAVIVEIERSERSAASPMPLVRDAARGFGLHADLSELCDAAAVAVRSITGYDRVMVYRFDADGHSYVLSEARDAALQPFLGRHYPASDIPRQARALYRTTMLRLIVDVNYTPAPLSPATDPRSGAPWDLGRANLRSVSPIHVQYLRNMGVAATMTISLLYDGDLWGLIACHHYAPRYLPFELRDAAETLGHALSASIARLEDAHAAAVRDRAQQALLAISARADRAPVDAFLRDEPLRAALAVDGFAFVRGDAVRSAGSTPPDERVAALAAWLRGRIGAERFVTDSLAKLNASFEDVAGAASGVYAATVGDGLLLALRPEHPQTVDWGGDPNKPVDVAGERLTPRGSFALWREEVRLRADPFEGPQLEALDRAAAWLRSRVGG